jgi:MFS transporter, DHA1 family, multidrug resistance protein
MLGFLRTVVTGRLDPASRLLLGQLVMFTGIAAVFPVAPFYVRSHGGGPVAVALFIAGPMIANTLVQVPAGHLVDRIGRKPVLIGSRLVYALFAFGLFFNLGPLWLLALFRCGQGASGGAYVPALRAALADLTPSGRRGEGYSQLQAVEMVGLLIGPAIGGAVAIVTYSAIFLCAGVATLLGVATLFRMPETKGLRDSGDEIVVEPPRGWWRSASLIVPSLGLLCAGALFSMYDVVWPQYLAARHIGTFLIGVSISVFALPVLLLATSAGRLSDRANRRVLVAGAFLIVATTAALYPELRSYPVILGVGMVEAIGFMIVEPTLFAVLSEGTAPEVRGRAIGIGGFFQFGGSAFGAAVLGSLYAVSAGLPFWCAALACVVAAAISGLWLPAKRLRRSPSPGVPQLKAVEAEIQL